MSEHVRTKAEQVPLSTHYSAKNYSCAFKCPICGKTQRQNLSFLGGKFLICDGQRMHKVSRKEWIAEQSASAVAGDQYGELKCAA